jgi:hypothetical protein
MKYRQCKLCKVEEHGISIRVSYIPEKYAVIGKTIRLKEDDDTWTDGWRVDSAGEPIDEKHLPDSHAEIKAHRRATGDALPKRSEK